MYLYLYVCVPGVNVCLRRSVRFQGIRRRLRGGLLLVLHPLPTGRHGLGRLINRRMRVRCMLMYE